MHSPTAPSAQKLASSNGYFHLVNNIDSSISHSPLPFHRKKEQIRTLNRTKNIMQCLRTYATAAKMATKELGLRLTWYLTGTIRPDTQVGMPPEVAAKALEEGFAMVPKLKKDIEDGKITSANIQFVSNYPAPLTRCKPISWASSIFNASMRLDRLTKD